MNLIQLSFINKDKIFRLANKLGFIEPLNASKLDSSIIYDIAAVHGSTPELRFSALIKAWQDGVRFKEIVVRTTSAVKIENEEARASGYPDTEMGFMQYIFTKLMLEEKVPVELKEMSVKWLDTEAPERKDRPQIHHTVIKLINEEEKIYDAGHILAVSTQPFAQYQNKIMEIVLTKAKLTNIKIASLAEEMPAETNLSILMDSIGRSIIVEAAYRALLAGDDRLLKMFM